MNTPTAKFVICQECEKEHPAEYSHEGQWGEGAIYAVVCTTDDDPVGLTDYYTTELLYERSAS